jgi:hypothetical protein
MHRLFGVRSGSERQHGTPGLRRGRASAAVPFAATGRRKRARGLDLCQHAVSSGLLSCLRLCRRCSPLFAQSWFTKLKTRADSAAARSQSPGLASPALKQRPRQRRGAAGRGDAGRAAPPLPEGPAASPQAGDDAVTQPAGGARRARLQGGAQGGVLCRDLPGRIPCRVRRADAAAARATLLRKAARWGGGGRVSPPRRVGRPPLCTRGWAARGWV